MSKVLAIIGAGDLGQQIAHFAISDNHFDDVVFFDDFETRALIKGYKVLGKIENVESYFSKGEFDSLFLGVGYKHMNLRTHLFEKFQGKIPFASIIHSTSTIDSSVNIGEGVIIYPGTIIDVNVTIKNNVLLNVGVCIAHDTVIESHCFLSPRVAIAGFVTIEECVILGINCTIIDNVKISRGCQIGGGGLVIKDVIEKGLYVGSPVRFIR